jgi:hypothetical protein
MKRARAAIALFAALLAIAISISIDAARRRAARDVTADRAVVALTGLPDLVLSSSSRWLRHPSQAEPGAASADVPSSLDVDPAGGWIGPPRAILRTAGVEIRRR